MTRGGKSEPSSLFNSQTIVFGTRSALPLTMETFRGRVGGLAFALGVGTAVLGGTAVAGADTGATRGSDDTSSAASQDSDPAQRPSSASKARAKFRTATTSQPEASDQAGPAAAVAPSRAHRRQSVSADPVPAAAARPSVPSPGPAPGAAASPDLAGAVAAAVTPNSFFNNQTPTLSYNPAENTVVDGHILGDLHPVDPDSAQLTITATKPTYGTVTVNQNGTFDYSPGVNFTGQDMFDVAVSDAGSGFHLHGFAGLINLLSFGLIGTSGHKKTETVFIGDQRAVVADGLNGPVDFRFLPDGRILVAEKGGAIKVIAADGGVLPQPLITLSVNTVGERGISGLAVDPQFATNGHIYVAYTTSNVKDRLSRFTVIGNTAAPASEKVLIETADTVAAYHHGGGLAFGPDGKLYWGKGDNTTGANAQDLTNIYGKILRLNPDGSAPSDNPSLGAGALPQIYAYGLRNPFRLTFTPTGQLLVADVGAAAFEELDRVVAGGNYGWPGSEGVCTSNCSGQINPIYTYAHGTGAAFSSVLAIDNSTVLIADEVQGWIKVLTCDAAYTSCGNPRDFDPNGGSTVELLRGPGTGGGVYQLIYQPGTLVRFGVPSSV